MRRMKLGTVDGNKGPVIVADFLLDALNRTPVDGRAPITIAEMRRRLRVIDKIENADHAAFVDLDDAEHDLLRGILSVTGLGEVSRAVVAIEDGVLAAEHVAPPQKQGE